VGGAPPLKVYTPPNRILSLDRYICSCDVVSPAGSSAPPSWKLCTEMLCNSYQREGSLVYMGDSTYCFVKVVERERFKRRRCASTGNKSMISIWISSCWLHALKCATP
jgi:hypothetical protein